MIESSISFFIDILVLFGNNKVTNIFASNFFKKRLKVRFFGRQKELQRIKDFLNRPQTGAMLILGKRRVGKTTLIKKALEDSDITSVIYTCIPSDLNTNLLLLSKAVSTSLNFPEIGFSNIQSLFDFLNTLGKKIVIVLDEYQDMIAEEDLCFPVKKSAFYKMADLRRKYEIRNSERILDDEYIDFLYNMLNNSMLCRMPDKMILDSIKDCFDELISNNYSSDEAASKLISVIKKYVKE